MLDLSQILTYAAALGIAAAIPGPGMAALVARSVSGGLLPGFSLLLGIILGDLIYLSFAVFGLTLIAHHFSALFAVVRWGAAAYLGYLALAILVCCTSTRKPGQTHRPPGVAVGLVLGLDHHPGQPQDHCLLPGPAAPGDQP
ncbi:MAG: LysE family transporter [Candidatus Pseudomonas colombiensis]|nr:MAG: LysE family transporter [Pseudomonas sp.]